MSSTHPTQLFTGFLDTTLEKEQVERVKSHLIFCNPCRQHLEDLEINVRLLKSTPLTDPPPGLEEAIFELAAKNKNVPLPEKRKGNATPSWFFSLRIWAAFGFILIFILLLKFSQNKSDSVETNNNSNSKTPDISLEMPNNKEGEKGIPLPLDTPPVPETKSIANNESRADEPIRKKEKPQKNTKTPSKNSVNLKISGFSSGFSRSHQSVISKQRSWEKTWKKHVKSQNSPPPIPIVDFENMEVLALFGGKLPVNGTSIKISRIETTTWEGKLARIVYYRLIPPSSGDSMKNNDNQPFLIQSGQKFSGKTFFKKIP